MITAKTAKRTEVYVSFVEDCEDNEGGYYCEVWDSEDMAKQLDNFCIHTNDCDCNDWDAIEEFAMNYISNITEY